VKKSFVFFIYRTKFISKIYFSLKRRKSFSLNMLDLKIEELLPLNNGFYVEIGANDGISQSNTKYFEVYKGWHGVLVEPYLINYKILQKARSKRNYFFNCACVPFDYEFSNVDLVYLNLMTTSTNLENDLESLSDHLEESKKHIDPAHIHKFQANARTMNSLLIEAGAPKLIDLLSLDVEGAEISVLRGIDHEQFRFKYILIECRNLRKMEEYLLETNYTLFSQVSHHDFIFKNSLT